MRCDSNMVRKYLRKFAMVICLSSLFTIVNFQHLHAQVLGTQTQVIKWLSNNALRSWFSNMGAEPEYCRRLRATYLAVDQIDGLCWPNEFNVRMKGIKAGKALWIGATNFADPVSNTTYPYKVVCLGKDAIFSGTEIFADELSLLGKFPHPNVYVDGVSASARDYDDIIDNEDNSLPADRIMMNRFHTSLGVSVTRKILSFSQQYHNNYYIYEYTFKNTGIIDESGQKKLNVPLTGVVFYFQSRFAFDGVSYNGLGVTGAGSWAPATSTWGRNTINDVIRKDGSNPGEFRAALSYWGPMSTSPYGSPAADIGLPGPNATAVTLLAGYQFAGTVVLHADKASNDPTDDITQPTTTMYAAADFTTDRNNQPTQYNASLMSQKYTTYMTIGHAGQTQADQIGKDANGWPTIGPANTFGTDAGGYMATQGFGPYTLAPGDSVRIVIAEAIAGMDWNKACEVGKNWFAVRTGTSNPTLQFPAGYKNGATTTDQNEYKNAWVFSGKDSLFQTFRRAIANYNSNYAIPQPPPPPDKFLAAGGGDRIKISWSNSAESYPNFDGYRLYRSEGKTDTTYDLIFECGKGTLSYDDQSAKRGSNYYYYIQSKDNGSTNPGNPSLNIPAGEPLVSSRYYTMTNNPTFLTRPAGSAVTAISYDTTFTGDGIKKIFVLRKSVLDSTGTIVRGISVKVDGVRQIPSTFVLAPSTFLAQTDTLKFANVPQANSTIEVTFVSPTGDRIQKLSEIRVVPNPYNLKARNIQYGQNDPSSVDKLGFFNLPPLCKIKIYTELGELIATIDHTNGSGDDYWYSLTTSRQVVVSGLYIAYFEVTESSADGQYTKGDHIFKKFIIIR
jgi:hypothetical protein